MVKSKAHQQDKRKHSYDPHGLDFSRFNNPCKAEANVPGNCCSLFQETNVGPGFVEKDQNTHFLAATHMASTLLLWMFEMSV